MQIRERIRKKLSLADDGADQKPSSTHPDSGESGEGGISPTEQTKVLVLVNENSPIIPTLLFLRRRGYKLKIIHKATDTIGALLNFKPDVLLFSWNLVRTDVRKVYRLITTKFKILCIVFAEENNSKSATSLMRSGIPHTLLPPVSGAGMHMRIQSLLRNKRAGPASTTATLKSSGRTKKGNFNNNRMVIRSSNSTPEDQVIGGSSFNPSSRATTLPAGSSFSLTDVPQQTSWSSIGRTMNDGQQLWQGVSKKDGKEKFYYFRGPEAPKYNEALQKWEHSGEMSLVMTEEKADPNLYDMTQEAPDSQGYNLTEEGNALNSSEYNMTQEGLGSDDMEATQEGGSLESNDFTDVNPQLDTASMEASIGELSAEELAAELQSAIGGSDEPKELSIEETLAKFMEAAPEEEEDEAEGDDLIQLPKDGKTLLTHKGRKHILAKCVQKAVGNAGEVPTGPIKPIENLSKCTVTIIKTTRFRGYLIGANASDVPDHFLMGKVMASITKDMQDLGEPLNPVTGILELQLDPLAFLLWAEAKADFFVKSSHKNDEVVFAYVPLDIMPEVVEEDSDMLISIDIAYIYPDKPLLFDVYIYMPKNNKYLLYLKKGSVFSNKTIIKLTHFNVQKLYIRKTDQDLFFAYGAKYKVAEEAVDFATMKKKAG